MFRSFERSLSSDLKVRACTALGSPSFAERCSKIAATMPMAEAPPKLCFEASNLEVEREHEEADECNARNQAGLAGAIF